VGTRCIQIQIPDDDGWERDAYSELYRLALWMLWERDIVKNGKPVADRWLKAIRTWKHCDGTPSPVAGLLEDFDMPLRVDCDCNVFVTCCDGSEKQILTADQVMKLSAGQPGPSSTPPAPGECKLYDFGLDSGKSYLLPSLVSTGDQLTLSQLDGATTDVEPLGRWNCPSGDLYFGGVCQPVTQTDPGAPAPSLPIGIPLYLIDGTYYDARVAVTMPGGVANKPGQVVCNYAAGGGFAGRITGVLQVCNNQAGSWLLSENLVIGSGHITPSTNGFDGGQSVWIPGSGWADVACHSNLMNTARYNILYVDILFANPVVLTHLDILYDTVVGVLSDGGGDTVNSIIGGGGGALVTAASASGTGKVLSWDGTLAAVNGLTILLYGSDLTGVTCPPTGSVLLRALNLRGSGIGPF